jgi:hypothetical protein
MKKLISLLVISMFVGSVAYADVPDPATSSVEPWDTWGQALVIPGSTISNDDVTVTVHNSQDQPIVGATVEIDLSGCTGLCIDPVDAGLTGTTDGSGVATLNPVVGGCEDCTITVRANGVTIRQYTHVSSPDWDGGVADGNVGVGDLAFFGAAFNQTQDACGDYDGDGAVGVTDLPVFGAAFNGGASNPNGCQ